MKLFFEKRKTIWDSNRFYLHYKDLSSSHPKSREATAKLMAEAIEDKHYREHKAWKLKVTVKEVTDDFAILEEELEKTI